MKTKVCIIRQLVYNPAEAVDQRLYYYYIDYNILISQSRVLMLIESQSGRWMTVKGRNGSSNLKSSNS